MASNTPLEPWFCGVKRVPAVFLFYLLYIYTDVIITKIKWEIERKIKYPPFAADAAAGAAAAAAGAGAVTPAAAAGAAPAAAGAAPAAAAAAVCCPLLPSLSCCPRLHHL